MFQNFRKLKTTVPVSKKQVDQKNQIYVAFGTNQKQLFKIKVKKKKKKKKRKEKKKEKEKIDNKKQVPSKRKQKLKFLLN